MKLNTGISYVDGGMKTALKGMQVQTSLINIASENVAGFDKVGYQRKEAVVSQFVEYLGKGGVATTADDKIGRLMNSGNPLDLAIATKGYFQIQTSEGVKLTRDGRFKLDKNGNLLTLDDAKVLSSSGSPIKLGIIPNNLQEVVVNTKGTISVLNKKTNKLERVADVGVVNANGGVMMNTQVKQGYNEYSNVTLENQFMEMMGPLRNFDANRQIFMIESSTLSKTISQLGQTS